MSDKAAMHFAWALDLDPRGAHHAARETADYGQLAEEDIRAEGTEGEVEATPASQPGAGQPNLSGDGSFLSD